MGNSKDISRFFIAVGVMQLMLGTVIIICSAIVIDKYRGSTAATISLWALYYAIPGILCIVAGTTTRNSFITASLVFNIFSILLSTVGAAVHSVLWKTFQREDSCTTRNNVQGECICFYKDSYRMSCSDGKLTHLNLAVLTVVYILMTLTTFAGSILGCSRACCDQYNEPDTVIMDASHSEPTTVVFASQNSELSIPLSSIVVFTNSNRQDAPETSPQKIQSY